MGAYDGAAERQLKTEEAQGLFAAYAGKLKECGSCSDWTKKQKGPDRCAKANIQNCDSLKQKVVYLMTRSSKGKKK